jgi:hypothetical protein
MDVHERAFRSATLIATVCLFTAVLLPRVAHADAGPPYLTNDPGTPGNDNWEINLASMQSIERGQASYQVPQIDLNFGLGDRIQLSYEIPYVVQTSTGQPQASGWSNAYPGVKWRFLDQGEGGWQAAVFPQLETAGSAPARRDGIAVDGPRLLLPLEVAKTIGPLNFNFEAGYFLPWHRPEERILGGVAGRPVTPRLELDAELYNDHVMGTSPNITTLDFGGRYKLQRGFILLFMAGRGLGGDSNGQVQFMGYLGVQILLSNYGRTLSAD